MSDRPLYITCIRYPPQRYIVIFLADQGSGMSGRSGGQFSFLPRVYDCYLSANS